MEFIQSSFQASFDARVERLNATELAGLRTLGLDVNPAYVKDLEEVYLNEFIKIVDSHVPTPPPAAVTTTASAPAPGSVLGDASSTNNGFNPNSDPDSSSTPMIPVLQIADPTTTAVAMDPGLNPLALPSDASNNVNPESGDPVANAELDENAHCKRNEQLWEHEWKLVDTYRRGSVGYNELRLFLRSCGSEIPARDLLRFVEMYGAPLGFLRMEEQEEEDEGEFVLTKAGFLKFRREYTEKDIPQDDSDRGLSSDEEGNDDNGDGTLMVERTAREGGTGNPDGVAAESEADPKPRRPGSATTAITSRNSSRSQSNSARDGIIVDPSALDQSDASDLDEDDEDESEAQHNGDRQQQQLADEAHADAFAED